MTLHRIHLSSKAMYSTGSSAPLQEHYQSPRRPRVISNPSNKKLSCHSQVGLDALLHDAQCLTSPIGRSLNRWILHEASMKGIHQTAKGSPMPKGGTLNLQSTNVRLSLSKLSQLCISIMDHLSCYNPSRTIQALYTMYPKSHEAPPNMV
jgi:hypothetical protein